MRRVSSIPSTVPVPVATAVDLEGEEDEALTILPHPFASTLSTGESKLSREEQEALTVMEKKVSNLGDARQRLLNIRNEAIVFHIANGRGPRGVRVRKKIHAITQAGGTSYHKKHKTAHLIKKKFSLEEKPIYKKLIRLGLPAAHAAAETAINEIRAHHEAMMSPQGGHPHLFKKEGEIFKRHRFYFPHGVGRLPLSLWSYDGQKKKEKDSKIVHKIFPRGHYDDLNPSVVGHVDPPPPLVLPEVPPLPLGGRKTRKHRRKHKRKTRKHKRKTHKRKTKKRKHRRKQKRKTHRR
jgi:hypothetical protein